MGLAQDIVQARLQKRHVNDEQPEPSLSPLPPSPSPLPRRTVEHSGLCRTQFDRNALCDCGAVKNLKGKEQQ
jgi:hypothetical protein